MSAPLARLANAIDRAATHPDLVPALGALVDDLYDDLEATGTADWDAYHARIETLLRTDAPTQTPAGAPRPPQRRSDEI